jgi:multicomponent Na+:H+ antiporter subunit D
VGKLFVTMVSIVWVLAGFYSFVYMEHEGDEQRFFGFYLVLYGVLIALDFSGNLVTMYLFYELMTLTSMPLVLHNGSKEAIMAALKYLFYSMCGAYMGLFGIFFLYRYCDTLTFTSGGSLNTALAAEHTGVLLVAVFVMLVGFGAKAGMFPLHSWLPTAHPVAPSPASAVLSGIIVKSGVLAIVRVVYYMVGADFIRGTWVQTVWMTMTLLTVFMGSMLAYRESVLKKRLAYSTVSQVSYILFGLSVLQPQAMAGALLHTVFHAFIKCALFLTAGIFIFQSGKTRVEEFHGIGKRMPKTLWCFTFASLALIGIPPASGFISKWYLAEGALSAEIGVFRYLGPAILLVSALLTAGYLLPITINGFLPGKDAVIDKKDKEPSWGMLLPLMILAALCVILGVLPGPLTSFASGIAASLM